MRRMTAALKGRHFRWYFAGQAGSLVGTWMQQMALGWMAYEVGGSAMTLAWVGFWSQIPILILGPLAAWRADHVEKRQALIRSQLMLMGQAAALALLWWSGRATEWHLMALALFAGVVSAMEIPVRQSYAARLVRPEDLPNSIALNSMMANAARLAGPALGGAALGAWGAGACFALNACSFALMITALKKLPDDHGEPRRHKELGVIQSVRKGLAEGWSHARQDRWVSAAILMAACLSFWGTPYATLLPAFIQERLLAGPFWYGALLSASGVGAFAAALTLTWLGAGKGLKKALAWTAPIGALALLGMATLARSPEQAAPMLALVGLGFMGTAAGASILAQSRVEAKFRGRVMGIFSMGLYGLAPIGGLLLGAVASHWGIRVAMSLSAMGVMGSALGIRWMMRDGGYLGRKSAAPSILERIQEESSEQSELIEASQGRLEAWAPEEIEAPFHQTPAGQMSEESTASDPMESLDKKSQLELEPQAPREGSAERGLITKPNSIGARSEEPETEEVFQ